MPDYVKRELHFVLDTDQTMHCRGGFHFKVAAVDAEFSLCPKIVSRNGHPGGDGDLPGNPIKRQVTGDLQVIFIRGDGFTGNGRAPEYYLRTPLWQEHDFAQFLVDDLLFRGGEDAAGFFYGCGFRRDLQRRSRYRTGIKLHPAGKFRHRDEVIVAFEPERTATEPVGDEFALRGVEPIALDGYTVGSAGHLPAWVVSRRRRNIFRRERRAAGMVESIT